MFLGGWEAAVQGGFHDVRGTPPGTLKSYFYGDWE